LEEIIKDVWDVDGIDGDHLLYLVDSFASNESGPITKRMQQGTSIQPTSIL